MLFLSYCNPFSLILQSFTPTTVQWDNLARIALASKTAKNLHRQKDKFDPDQSESVLVVADQHNYVQDLAKKHPHADAALL